jgi:hypothetical protein
MEHRPNLRREERSQAPATIRVSWRDSHGVDKFATVKTHDVSPSGLRLELPEAVPLRTLVILQSTALGLHGTASVRSCVSQKGRYVVGLEFTGGLKWDPAGPKRPRYE